MNYYYDQLYFFPCTVKFCIIRNYVSIDYNIIRISRDKPRDTMDGVTNQYSEEIIFVVFGQTTNYWSTQYTLTTQRTFITQYLHVLFFCVSVSALLRLRICRCRR